MKSVAERLADSQEYSTKQWMETVDGLQKRIRELRKQLDDSALYLIEAEAERDRLRAAQQN
jgi:hypothetical protein